ncbi:hypothetical protein ACFLYF_01830 [Chloroflexota bacterium]
MKCTYHPDVETNLRCGKCGKPICPRDMVQTPVGVRCPDCAKPRKLPTYQIPAAFYLRAAATGLVISIMCGLLWAVIELVIPFFSFNLLLAPAVGYTIGEAVSRSVNRKRGSGLAVIASAAVAISYFMSLFVTSLFLGIPFFAVLPLGLLGIIYNLIALALGIFVAVTRLR